MEVLKSVAERWSPIVEMAMKDWGLVCGGGRGSEGGRQDHQVDTR